MKTLKLFAILLTLTITSAGSLYSHCEIPCGIYGDTARIEAMREHLTTIEKSMGQIMELSAADQPNYNQLVRWVTNKEEHADALQEIATQYFMFQRVKPADESDPVHWNNYLKKLVILHRITVLAMKTKQSTDLDLIKQLRTNVSDFETAYFSK
jgi:nickel superoxide dismutase